MPKLVSARFSPGRVTVPVRPNQYLYARFKNVAGVPAGKPEGGLSISKLQSLDALIERLKQIKGNKSEADSVIAGTAGVKSEDDARIDALIQQLSGQLHQAANSAAANPYTAASAGSLQGMVVNLVM